MPKTIIGILESRTDAEHLVDELLHHGFSRDEIEMVNEEPAPPPEARLAWDEMYKSLTSAGVSEEKAHHFEDEIRHGRTLVAVHSSDALASDAAGLVRNEAREVEEIPETYTGERSGMVGEGARRTSSEKDVRVPIVEEELKVGKRTVQEPGVRITKHVEEKPVEEQVTLRDETVKVERVPVSGEHTPTQADVSQAKEGTVEVTRTREEAVVSKEPRVVEEVVVTKEVHEHPETIRDTVKRTDVEVEETAREFARDPRYQDRQWSEAEPEMRTDWERRQPGTWERFKNAIRNAFSSRD